MKESILLRTISDGDLPEVLEIYNYFIINTTATFHQQALSLESLRELVYFERPPYCTYVIEGSGEICGYVLLTQHKKREAYDGTAEVSVYLRREHWGKGLGSLALSHIEAHAVTEGIHVLVATICGENENSIRLFSYHGYTQCAHYREVGRKFGRWLDVVAYQKILS